MSDQVYLIFHQKKELRFHSRVSLRSFFVNWALKQNSGIKVFVKGACMTLEPEDLREKGTHNRNSEHVAMFSGQGIKAGERYYLIDYRFVPDGTEQKIKAKQENLFGPVV